MMVVNWGEINGVTVLLGEGKLADAHALLERLQTQERQLPYEQLSRSPMRTIALVSET